MLVLSRRIIALRETFPPPSPPFRPYPSRTVSSSDRPFYPSGNSTRLQLFRAMARQQGASGTAESSGWRQVCIFTRRPPSPIRAYITVVVLSTRRVRVRVLFTAFRSFTRAIPATTIYTKSVFHLFHATDVASPPSARESSRTREMLAI